MKLSTIASISAAFALSVLPAAEQDNQLAKRTTDVDCDDENFGYGDNNGDGGYGSDSDSDSDADDDDAGSYGGDHSCNAAIGNKVIAVTTKTVRVHPKFTYIRFRFWAWVCKNGQRKRVAAARNPILRRIPTRGVLRHQVGRATRRWRRTHYNGKVTTAFKVLKRRGPAYRRRRRARKGRKY